MPSPWDFDVDDSDIEDEVLPLPKELDRNFDGDWRATTVSKGVARKTTVTISGANVWHRGSLFATLRVVTQTSCVLVTQGEDVKGFLSDDGATIDWDDGDSWPRAVHREPRPAAPAEPAAPVRTLGEEDGAERAPLLTAEDTVAALLQQDLKRLCDTLDDGVPVDSTVVPADLWQAMRWDPKWTGEPPRTTLLTAAVLLQWPEGVEACVRHGADVNATYAGPFRRAGGGATSEAEGAPMLRVALSAKGPAQCTICQELLRAKVHRRTFQMVRKRAKAEMDFVTAGFLEKYSGGFLES